MLVSLLLRHIAVLVGGGLIGAFYGQTMLGLLISLLAMLGWHLFNLFRLEQWLRTGHPITFVGERGIWARSFARITFINERAQRHQKNWRRLAKELRASAKAFPDGGVILNVNGEILNYNKAARHLLGLRKKRDKRQRIDHLIRHPDFVDYLETGPEKESVVIPSPLHRETWLSCRIIPYGPEQKLLLVRDITQSVKLEQMRQSFVANASHELRSPLTVIAGYLDAMAEDSGLPETWKYPVEEMREQATRMSALVRDLLQLSKLESSESSSRELAVDIAAILSASRNEALALDKHPRSIELVLESGAKVLGEESELRSVVSNLLSNAVRYTPPEGAVKISWQVDKKGGHLAVEDTGIGILADDIPRLTERFYRADGGRARQKGGTGLGLAIVKHALKRHDAELEVRSTPGKGSLFVCHFPSDRLVAS
jgi:two-component system phosphate regulon sensor histidine kinase PhoR